jgi:hypothetical protein
LRGFRAASATALRPLSCSIPLDTDRLPDRIVARHDPTQLLHPVALLTAPVHLHSRVADMNPRLRVDASLRMAAVIDPRLVPVSLQMTVRKMRPLLPPLAKLRLVELPVLRRRKPLWPKRAPRHHDVRMMVPLVAVLVRRMDRDIDGVAFPNEGLPRKILHKPFALLLGQLVRKRNLDLPCELRVLASLCPLRTVPKLPTIFRPVRRALRRKHSLEDDPLGARAILLHLSRLVIDQPRARPIGRRRNRALPFSSADDLGGQVKDGHASNVLLVWPCIALALFGVGFP